VACHLFGRDAELGRQIAQLTAAEDLTDLICANRKILPVPTHDAACSPRPAWPPLQQPAKATWPLFWSRLITSCSRAA
jgi:hypothetical protein